MDLFKNISKDTDSSDYLNRWDYLKDEIEPFTMQGTADIPKDFKEDYLAYQNMSDEEIFESIHDDFESEYNLPEDQEAENRFDLSDEQAEPLDIPINVCDFILTNGDNAYYFQAKHTITEDAMVYNNETDTYN